MSADTLIQVENLRKYYKDGEIKALDGVNADIRKGKVVVVIGPSGSGKSTFLRCLNLLELPTSGTVTFEGVDITDPKVNINLHRQKMGMVFQHFNLFPNMTVLRNMTVAPMELLKKSKAEAEKRPWSCSSAWALPTAPTPIPASSPADRSSASPSCAHCAWSPR